MTAQGIMSGAGSAMNAVLSGFPAASASVKGAKENSFEQFMESSKRSNEKETTVPIGKTAGKQDKAISKSVNEQAKELFSAKTKTKDVSVPTTEETADISAEAAEAVSTLLLQVKQLICETLDISEEQLSVTMDELGLQDVDLLDRENLQQIFLNVNQTDTTEFLTNENLFDEFAGMVQMVEQKVEASELTSDDVKTVWKALEENQKLDVTQTVLSELPHSEIVTEQERSEEEVVSVTADTADAKPLEVAHETKTGSGSSYAEGHKAEAKKEGSATVVSSETDAEVRNVFIDALVSQVSNENAEGLHATEVQVREIANQIMEQIKITIRPEQTNMELQLNPEHLGRVNLTITEKEGRMTAQFMTQTEVAKEAIESQMSALRESLQNQGIKVEAIEVTVSEFGFEQGRETGQNENGDSGRKRKSGMLPVEEAEDNTAQPSEYFGSIDSSVDYSA